LQPVQHNTIRHDPISLNPVAKPPFSTPDRTEISDRQQVW